MSMVRVVVTGSRSWTNQDLVEKALARLVAKYGTQRLLVIEGGAPGADKCARQACKAMGIHCMTVWALWDTLGRAAGPVRNSVMVDELQPDYVVAFHWDLADSKGTADCVRRAEKAEGVRVLKVLVPREVGMTEAAGWHRMQAAKKKARRKKGKA